jgi:hypothetical protein
MLDPVMEMREGKYPHHILKHNRLCLYYPKFKEWMPHMFLADTIIPWSSLWLYYYDHWLKYDKWLGGGTNHIDQGVVEIDSPPLHFTDLISKD